MQNNFFPKALNDEVYYYNYTSIQQITQNSNSIEIKTPLDAKVDSSKNLSMATVILLRRAQLLITRSTCASHKITRAMSSMLIDDPKYSWLKDLGLGATNNGAFYGVWGGSGEVTCSVIALFTNVNRQCGVLKCHCFLNTIYEHFQSNLHSLKNKFQFQFI